MRKNEKAMMTTACENGKTSSRHDVTAGKRTKNMIDQLVGTELDQDLKVKTSPLRQQRHPSTPSTKQQNNRELPAQAVTSCSSTLPSTILR